MRDGTDASDLYPTDGRGGTTTTAASSTALNKAVVVHGVVVEGATTMGAITLKDHGGTTHMVITPPTGTTTQVFDIPGGLQLNNGLRVTIAGTAMNIVVLYSLMS